ncbi:MAG: DUF1565 domain-containing protein, partial [Deltaproteobacteria bacterium]|nr:DUF1565 domain-containing protein [Deltaproteobacteria bacterium]
MYLKRQIAKFFTLSFMAACLFFISLTLPLHADDYYIDINSGSDAIGDGTQGNPWKTLHNAISYVDGDDNVHMAAGTYDIASGEVDSALVINNSNVTIQGDTNGGTIIDGYS